MTELSSLTKLLKSADTEALIELASLTGLAGTTFVQGDPHQSAYNEGIRSIGLRLLALSEKEVFEVTKETFRKRFTHKRK
jgi:hypothetical protein